jgi:hypothetical protein
MKWLLLTLCLFGGTLLADWSIEGVAVKCDEANKKFEIMRVTETSDPKYDVIPEPRFVKLSEGEHTLNCKLESKTITTEISVFGPQERGACMASGYVSIRKILDQSGNVLLKKTPFNWHCIHSPPITRIKIKEVSDSIQIELCEFEKCSIKSIN